MAAAFSDQFSFAVASSIFSTAVYENLGENDGFPLADGPVYLLGKLYHLPDDRADLEQDVQSKLWFTYRKGFSAIGGTGPTADVGWGCMLRCGQMLLAQTLITCHLTRDWRWKAGRYDPKYFEILRLFQDRKDCCYSIHQIASMGASEGKAVGEWFGPNTVVQVLRKLAVYDKWTGLVIHVAMDNSVIIEDICKLCEVNESLETGSGNSLILSKYQSKCKESAKCSNEPTSHHHHHKLINGSTETGKTSKKEDERKVTSSQGDAARGWRPLLLVIPLRLGLSEINATYFDAVKVCFRLKQSVGIIGGKPSHAHWFIGYTDNRLFYLDPHTVQPFVDFSKKEESDDTFHCSYPCYMNITELDPSIAVGFYCGSRDDFDDLCSSIRKSIIAGGAKTPMFELHDTRPVHFPPIQPYCLDKISTRSNHGSSAGDKQKTDTDDEYEIL